MGLFRKLLDRGFYLNSAAAVSSLLLLATLILWPVSYHRDTWVSLGIAGQSEYELDGQFGRMRLLYTDNDIYPLPRGLHFSARQQSADEAFNWSYTMWRTPDDATSNPLVTTLGVSWYGYREGFVLASLYIPFSYLAVLFSILPLLAFRSIRRRRKAARLGLCRKCGYDLRAQHAGSGGAVCP